MNTLQHFTQSYLDECRKMNPTQIVKFLDDFRKIIGQQKNVREKLTPISIKMPESLLLALKKRAKKEGKAYQALIKEILLENCQ